MSHIDLNSDVGEGAGADAEILEQVTSANVACGFHAGDPASMRATVALALARGVAVGAHPGIADREAFGRGAARVSGREAYDLVVYQVGALAAFAAAAGTRLQHVKPHGALYNLAATDPEIAAAISRAVRDVDPGLALFGLAGSRLLAEGRASGLKTAGEVFADRGYRADGTLVPRTEPGALVEDAREAVRRAVRMAGEGRVRTVDGADLEIRADTICVHGDAPGAAGLARALRAALAAEGFTLRAIGRDH
jgi:5-oxoprolinase (ATP-hydrolysing) subunit A